MNNEQYRDELNLMDLLYGIFRKWKSIIIVAFVFGALFGGLKLVQNYNTSKATVYTDEQLEAMEAQKKVYELEIQSLQEQVTQEEKFVEESVFMSLDAYNVHEASLYYRVEGTKEKYGLVDEYMYFVQTDLPAYVIEKIDLEIDVVSLTRMINVRADYDNAIFNIAVVCDNEETCEIVVNAVKKSIDEYYDNVTSAYNEHELVLMTEKHAQKVRADVLAAQNSYVTNLKSVQDNLNKKITEYNSFKTSYVTVSISKYEIVKFVIIGIVFGCFLAIVYHFVAYFIGDKIKHRKVITSKFDLAILGDFTSIKCTKIQGLIRRSFAQPYKNVALSEEYQILSNKINALSNDRGLKKIVFCGNVSLEAINELVKSVENANKDSQIEVIGCENIRLSAEAVNKVVNSDAVVLVEQIYRSTLSELALEIQEIKDVNKTILGVIII